MASATANVLIGNSVVEGGCPSIVGADCTSWGGNLSDDPLLLPLADNGGLVKTLAIEVSGSTRDAGDASYCADGYTEGVDARGVTRPQGPACDIGAYELQYPTGPRCYVKASAPGPTHDGNSWATAYAHLYDATALTTCKEIWVAAGFYTPHPISPGPIYYGLGLLSTTAVYGGFSGFETSLSQRDWKNNVSVLSGDVDHDDINVDGNHIDENVSDIQGSSLQICSLSPSRHVGPDLYECDSHSSSSGCSCR